MGEATLIDTHVLIWLVGSGRPSSATEERLVTGQLLVSAASAFEIATKVWLGKLDSARAVFDDWPRTLARLDAGVLDVTAAHALAAGSLDWDHRDPFDRLIVAQAAVEGLTLVTADRAMLTAPGVDLLPW